MVVPEATPDGVREIDCPSTTRCVIVGLDGLTMNTANGGTSWTTRSSGSSEHLRDVSCAAASACWVVGDNRTLFTTSDGGASWAPRNLTISGTIAGTEDFTAIDCPSTSDCWLGAGRSNDIYATHDGGASWLPQPTDGGVNWNAISCPNTTECWGSGGVTGGAASNALVVPAERQVP